VAGFQLRIAPRASALNIAADPTLERSYRVTSKGAKPRIREHDGEVDIDYSLRGRLRALSRRGASLSLALNRAFAWSIELRGGAAGLRADLRDLRVAGITIAGGAHDIVLDLPRPPGELDVRIEGGVAGAIVHRPPGVPVALEVMGGASDVRLDGEQLGPAGGALRKRTPSQAQGDGELAVHIRGGASGVTVDEKAG
jgi:hypothetical protein